jgi:hypothetical protein
MSYKILPLHALSGSEEVGKGEKSQSLSALSLIKRATAGQYNEVLARIAHYVKSDPKFGWMKAVQFKDSTINGFPVTDLATQTIADRVAHFNNALSEAQFDVSFTNLLDILFRPEDGLLLGHPLMQPYSSVYMPQSGKHHSATRHRDVGSFLIGAILIKMFGVTEEQFTNQQVISLVYGMDTETILSRSLLRKQGSNFKPITGYQGLYLVGANQQLAANDSRNMTPSELIQLADESKGLNMSDPASLNDALKRRTLAPNGSTRHLDNSAEYFARRLALAIVEREQLVVLKSDPDKFRYSMLNIATLYELGRKLFKQFLAIEDSKCPYDKKYTTKQLEKLQADKATGASTWNGDLTYVAYGKLFERDLQGFALDHKGKVTDTVDTRGIDALIEFLTTDPDEQELEGSWSNLSEFGLGGVVINNVTGLLPVEAVLYLGFAQYPDKGQTPSRVTMPQVETGVQQVVHALNYQPFFTVETDEEVEAVPTVVESFDETTIADLGEMFPEFN